MDSEQYQDNYEEGEYHENGEEYEAEENLQENDDDNESGEYIINDMEDPLMVHEDEQNGGVGVFIKEEKD